MKRRQFITLLSGAAAAWPVVVRGQQPKMPVVGFLHQASPSLYGPRIAAFRQGLREAGYVEGQNIVIEFRPADKANQFPRLAEELVELKVDIIVAGGSEAVGAAQRATRSTPIVMSGSSDPVGTGFVLSLGRPGGNITGLSLLNPELAGKRLELLKDVVSDISPVMVLWNPDDPPAVNSFKETEATTQVLGLTLQSAPVRGPDEFENAFNLQSSARPKTLVILPAPMMGINARRIAELALKNKLPSVSNDAAFPKAGGLMSYGASFDDLFRQAALYVVKILRGAKPADLPVQQPTKFELVLNLKTAKALGITVPPSVLGRADELIE